MKPLPLLVLLVLVPLAWGPAPRGLLSPPCGAAGAAPGVSDGGDALTLFWGCYRAVRGPKASTG